MSHDDVIRYIFLLGGEGAVFSTVVDLKWVVVGGTGVL